MTTKKKFAEMARDQGYTDQEIVGLMKKRRVKRGPFDDEKTVESFEQKKVVPQKEKFGQFFTIDPSSSSGFQASSPGQRKELPPKTLIHSPKQKVDRLFNLPPGAEKAIFPRATETRKRGGGAFRMAVPGAMDLISTVGRGVAAIPSLIPGGETPQQSFARKEGTPGEGLGKIREFVGTTVRDPITALSTIATGGTSIPAKAIAQPMLQRVKRSLAKGATEQLFPAFTRQVEKSSRTGKIDIPKQTGEMLFEVGMGAAGETLGAEAFKQLTPFGKQLLRKSAKFKDVTAKIAGPNVSKGVHNLINDIVAFKLESPIGGFSGMAKKANSLKNKKYTKLDEIVEKYSKANPDELINVDNIFTKLRKDVKAGDVSEIVGKEDEAAEYVGEIFNSLALRKLSGDQPTAKLRDVKAIIDKHTAGFKKGPFASEPEVTRKADLGRLAYRAINEAFGEKIPEAKKLGQELRRLNIVDHALLEAEKRTGNNNFISLRNAQYGASRAGSGKSIFTTLALMLAKAATERGRGPSAVLKMGRVKQAPEILRTFGAESVAFGAEDEKNQEKLKDLFGSKSNNSAASYISK